MKAKVILVASQLLFTSISYAGGSQTGTPPARTVEEALLSGTSGGTPPLSIDLGKGVLGRERIEQLLGNLPSRDLIKTLDGKTLIPLSPENIRRLNLRTSTGIEATLKTDLGETFRVKPINSRLIDKFKAAEVVEKSGDGSLTTPVE